MRTIFELGSLWQHPVIGYARLIAEEKKGARFQGERDDTQFVVEWDTFFLEWKHVNEGP